jgi:hypothetical protein
LAQIVPAPAKGAWSLHLNRGLWCALGLAMGLCGASASALELPLTVLNFSKAELELVSLSNRIEKSTSRVGPHRGLQRWTSEGRAWRLRRTHDGRDICSFVTSNRATTVTVDHPLPPSAWYTEAIAGFEVSFSPDLFREDEAAERARAFMRDRLEEVLRLVPTSAAPALKETRFWLGLAISNAPVAFYAGTSISSHEAFHDGTGVVIPNILRFIERTDPAHPLAVLHELAHAYHHQVLGKWNSDIKRAYETAKMKGLYLDIESTDGRRHPIGYALTNDHEYFAELSEAFFGRNEQFPFTREQLRDYDPDGYRVVELAWDGLLAREAPGDTVACRSSGWTM